MPKPGSNNTLATTLVFPIIAVLIATTLIHSPEGLLRYATIAIPYVFLGSLWFSFRSIEKMSSEIEEQLQGEVQSRFRRMRQQIFVQIAVAAAAIGMSLGAGFRLGHP